MRDDLYTPPVDYKFKGPSGRINIVYSEDCERPESAIRGHGMQNLATRILEFVEVTNHDRVFNAHIIELLTPCNILRVRHGGGLEIS